VIPNPFGPYEDLRFTSYLAKTWIEGKSALVKTPDYIRDNIHVDLLARSYATFAESFSDNSILRPSGYVETQGEFAYRMARELGSRLSIPCLIDLKEQSDFSEPMKRWNSDRCGRDWNETRAWDSLARYYQDAFRYA
jgi:hypothetical protein